VLLVRTRALGHAIRKAAAELDKKPSSTEGSTAKKISRSTQQKRKMGKKKQKGNLQVTATPAPEEVVARNPTVANYPSAMNVAMAASNMNLGIGMGDFRTDRATTSFLTPHLSSLLSSTSSLASSNVATHPPLPLGQDFPSTRIFHGTSSAASNNSVLTGQDRNTNDDTNNFFLQTLQRGQQFMNDAQRQQQVMNFLRPSSNVMSMLTHNDMDLQRRRVVAAGLGGGTSFGMSSLSHPRLGLPSHGLLFPSAAATIGMGLLDNRNNNSSSNNNNNLLLQLQLQLQQRAAAEALLSGYTDPRDSVQDGTSSGDTSHQGEPPV
jgi:hypothetical protein